MVSAIHFCFGFKPVDLYKIMCSRGVGRFQCPAPKFQVLVVCLTH